MHLHWADVIAIEGALPPQHSCWHSVRFIFSAVSVMILFSIQGSRLSVGHDGETWGSADQLLCSLRGRLRPTRSYVIISDEKVCILNYGVMETEGVEKADVREDVEHEDDKDNKELPVDENPEVEIGLLDEKQEQVNEEEEGACEYHVNHGTGGYTVVYETINR